MTKLPSSSRPTTRTRWGRPAQRLRPSRSLQVPARRLTRRQSFLASFMAWGTTSRIYSVRTCDVKKKQTNKQNKKKIITNKIFLWKDYWCRQALKLIDYRCEDGRFLVSASCVTFSNPISLSTSETEVFFFRNEKLKKHLSDWAQCQKAVGGIYITKKWRAETQQPGLEFDSFKRARA